MLPSDQIMNKTETNDGFPLKAFEHFKVDLGSLWNYVNILFLYSVAYRKSATEVA